MMNREMKSTVTHILGITVLLIILLFASQLVKEEGFQSAGTLVQLETSHVPTRAEIRDRQHWLRRRVHQDLVDLTA